MNGTTDNIYDVIIIGAGVSGINTAYHVQTQGPKNTTYVVLESRPNMGGTWDLFKYPGIRSDSDLYTFGFPWRPWTAGPAIAEARFILKYLHGAAQDTGIDTKVMLGHKVMSADWSSENSAWTLEVDVSGERQIFRCRFMILGTGYYDYEIPLQTDIPGIKNFNGEVVHPQFWPTNLDYSGKRVVIVGSGATAVTMFPNIARTARQTTIIQRSPTYILSHPNHIDLLTRSLRWLSPRLAYKVNRIRFLVFGHFFFYLCRAFPSLGRSLILGRTSRELPPNIPRDPHFNPRYNPWEQRLCMTPDGDFYQAMREGQAGIVTGNIKAVTNQSVVMDNGEEVPADIIITATGLKLKFGGGICITTDGKPYVMSSKYLWRGMMLQDLPNTALIMGYTNASWTLGAEVTAQMLTRLLKEIRKRGAEAIIPRIQGHEAMIPRPMLNLSSTYIKQAVDVLPVTGNSGPWKARTNYFWDIQQAKWGDIQSGLEYR